MRPVEKREEGAVEKARTRTPSLPHARSGSDRDGPSGMTPLQWQLALDGAGIGGFDWDLASGRVEPDERLQHLFGYDAGEFDSETDALDRVHPEDRPLVERALRSALETGDYRVEFRVALPGGSTRWLAARGRMVENGGSHLVGVAYDVTDVRSARDHAAHVLATMSSGYLAIDRDWRVTYMNAEAERVLGRSYEQLVGQNLWEQFPGSEQRAFGHYYQAAMTSGRVVAFEEYYPGLATWFEVRAVPGTDGLEVFFLDITDRRQAEEAAQTAAERLELLARVSGELAATLDAEEAVAQLARLLVPALGTWCIVTLAEEDGLRDIGWWHDEPTLRPLVEEYARERIPALTEHSFIARVLRTGQTAIIPRATPEISAVLSPGRARDLLHRLAPAHALILPLTARGRTVGLVSIFRDASFEPPDTNDMVTAQEVASRAGLALDNARLYHQQQELAEGLQRSLLTDPPETPGLQIVVRYQPAAQAAQVGGDWYDAFLRPDGTTVVVIGDVVGHDVEAAAAMGQLRGLLRGLGYQGRPAPGDVLSRLDAAMEGLMAETTATAVVAELELPPAPGGTTRLRWSNAGHPPPIVIDPAGKVSVLTDHETDLLLGLDPATPRATSALRLAPGTTVLLYTDGLVERRGQSIDEGLTALEETLVDLAAEGASLDELCDACLRRLLPPDAEDDAALVAVRLH